jgi:hypothetical protein
METEMITTTNILRVREPVPEEQKMEKDVVQVYEHRNGATVEGQFFHSLDPAISHASRGGRRFYVNKL